MTGGPWGGQPAPGALASRVPPPRGGAPAGGRPGAGRQGGGPGSGQSAGQGAGQGGGQPPDRLGELITGELGQRPLRVAELTEQGELWTGGASAAGLDAVRCTEAVFPRLSAEGALPGVLRGVAAALRPGGVFAAAVPEFGEHRPSAPPPRVVDLGGERELTTAVWDWAADGESYRLELVRLRRSGGRWELMDTVSIRHGVLRPRQVHRLLADAGFAAVRRLPVTTARYPVPVWVAARR